MKPNIRIMPFLYEVIESFIYLHLNEQDCNESRLQHTTWMSYHNDKNSYVDAS